MMKQRQQEQLRRARRLDEQRTTVSGPRRPGVCTRENEKEGKRKGAVRERADQSFLGSLAFFSFSRSSPLSPSDLRKVLTEVKCSLISQYTALFGYSGIEIRFTRAAIDQICRKAAERGGGARGLRGIMVGLP